MILQVYDKNSCTLIDNVDEAKIFETPVQIPKEGVTDWINNRICEDMEVFSFVNNEPVVKTDEDPYYYFREIFLEMKGFTQTIYVQKHLNCYLLNDQGKTVQNIK